MILLKEFVVKIQELAGKVSMECVEDVNTMGFTVFFVKK